MKEIQPQEHGTSQPRIRHAMTSPLPCCGCCSSTPNGWQIQRRVMVTVAAPCPPPCSPKTASQRRRLSTSRRRSVTLLPYGEQRRQAALQRTMYQRTAMFTGDPDQAAETAAEVLLRCIVCAATTAAQRRHATVAHARHRHRERRRERSTQSLSLDRLLSFHIQ